MSLSQVQIIRSLGEALAWFEKELAWGVQASQLGHLTGRIGELYAAMITRGQMALATNQHGYDIISADRERVSVKTVTTSTHVSFRKSTLHHVDRVLVLRLNVDEGEASIEEVLDCSTEDLRTIALETATDHSYRLRSPRRPALPLEDLPVTAEAKSGRYHIMRYENGSISIYEGGQLLSPVMPILRQIAAERGVSLTNTEGGARNTRQLGAEVLAVLSQQESTAGVR
jgi:hypothetical protein